MIRRLAVLLVLLLSLQWSSSAIAAMCMHEGDAKASHLGHHAHSHDAAAHEAAAPTSAAGSEAGAIKTGSRSTPDGDLQSHADCAGCHLTASPVLPATTTLDRPAPLSTGRLAAPAARLSPWAGDLPFRPPRT